MRIKFNKFERVAGLFVLVAIVGSISVMLGIAIKKGWFESKVNFTTRFDDIQGVYPGTVVQMAGLRAGNVESVELQDNGNIIVHFQVSERFYDRIREDSVVQTMRPFIIGEKVLDITVGTPESAKVERGTELKSQVSMDIMDLLSGKKLGPYFEMMGGLVQNLRSVAEAFLDPERSKVIIKSFDQLYPLILNLQDMSKSMVGMSRQLVKEKNLERMVGNLAQISDEAVGAIPDFKQHAPHFSKDMAKMVHNLNIVTEELARLGPMLRAVSGDLPRAGLKAIDALDEAVVLMRAMQKNYFIRDAVAEIRDEQKARDKETERRLKALEINRLPANDGAEADFQPESEQGSENE